MSPRRGTQRWRLHVTLAVGLTICLLGFAVELQRGLRGHLPAWVYVVEWPTFAIVGAVMWWRLLHDEADDDSDAVPQPAPDEAVRPVDPELEAWRAYVTRIESGERTEPE